jgi:uncharacterized membrane protein (UPF0127 family)
VSRRSGGALRATVAGLAAALLLLVGCSSDASTEATTASTSSTTTPSGSGPTSVPDAGGSSVAPEGFTSVTLVVTRSDGTVEEFCVWLADTPALRQQGLMGVTDPTLGGAGAMVFAFEDDTAGSFWMKDTLLPLSIAWYGADGAFVSSADMQPCPDDVDDCPTYGPGGRYRYAVEVALGGLGDLGLGEGSTIALGSSCSVVSQAA